MRKPPPSGRGCPEVSGCACVVWADYGDIWTVTVTELWGLCTGCGQSQGEGSLPAVPELTAVGAAPTSGLGPGGEAH